MSLGKENNQNLNQTKNTKILKPKIITTMAIKSANTAVTENTEAMTKMATETMDKMTETSTEMLTKVKTTLEETATNLKKTINFDAAPDFMKATITAQEDLAKNWFESLMRVANVKSTDDLNTFLTEQVKHFQTNFTKASDKAFWMTENKEVKDMMSTEFAQESILKVISLCQPAK